MPIKNGNDTDAGTSNVFLRSPSDNGSEKRPITSVARERDNNENGTSRSPAEGDTNGGTNARGESIEVTGEMTSVASSSRHKRNVKPSLSKIDFGEFYPEGGWGWVICVAVAVVYVLCSGFHFSYGSLYLVIHTQFNNSSASDAVWLGSLGVGVNVLLSPIVTSVCRRKSPRLCAVLGGLVVSLGTLFLAFSDQIEHFFISYGIVFSMGSGITCQTANIMIGRYFKQHRDIAEVFPISGTGVGIVFMSVLISKSYQSIGWMGSLLSMSGLFIVTTICGALYRSVTLFHPRRKVIMHIKKQRKSSLKTSYVKPSYFDFSALRMRSVQSLMLVSAIIAVGLYVPVLLLMQSANDVTDSSDRLLLLNVYLGLGMFFGTLGHAYVIIRNNKKCAISRRYLCQSATLCCGVISLMVTMARDYNAFAIFAWLYGICLGGYTYSLKSYVYELAKSRVVERAWGYVSAAQSLPILIGTPIAAYINGASSSRPGYLFAGIFPLVGSMLFFAMSKAEKHPSNSDVIEKHESNADFTVVETATLLNVNLSDFVTTKPLASQFVLSSGETKRGSPDDNLYQLQCIISPKDSKHLTKIAEDSEAGAGGETSRASGMSAVSDYLMTRTSRARTMDRDSSNGASIDHAHDLFTSSSSSSNDRKHVGKKGERVVKVELVDPPSQEKESTATVSYDSDLYINLCEAIV